MNSGVKNKGDPRQRQFVLPTYQALTKEQEFVRRLPADGCYLITGGPGTGKSVVCLIRAREIRKQAPRSRFLVYNVLLERFCNQLLPRVCSSRILSWFKSTFITLCGQQLPFVEGDSKDLSRIDWDCVEDILGKMSPIGDFPNKFIVIDEGQDVPVDMYYVIHEYCKNIFVAADENQALTVGKSNIDEIRRALDIKDENVIELRDNWRNNYPVARLARHFYNNPRIPPPELPEENENDEIPCLITFTDFNAILKQIVTISNNYKRELIGIITPDNRIREKYYNGICRLVAELDYDISVSTYHTNMPVKEIDIRFDRGGIIIINMQSCKGLEFDTVFIADLHEYYVYKDSERHLKNFYVMISRARKQLFFLIDEKNKLYPMNEWLPRDETILRRIKS